MTLHEFQNTIADILNNYSEFVNSDVKFYSENNLDIEYEIKTALGKQGIVGIVMTPNLSYEGHNNRVPIYSMNDFTIQICEQPVINRACKNPMTVHSAMILVTQILTNVKNEVGYPVFGTFTPTEISIEELDESLLVGESKFTCTFAFNDDSTDDENAETISAEEALALSDLSDELSAIEDLI